MFIVVVTLSLLAVMGVYGLTATSNDVKSAGHIRERAQASHAAEYGAAFASEVFDPGNADTILNQMITLWNTAPNNVIGAQPCWSANARTAAINWVMAKDELCFAMLATGNSTVLTPQSAQILVPAWKNVSFFSADSIGSGLPGVRANTLNPFVKIEFTNPIGVHKGSSGKCYVQLTITDYVFVATPDGAKPEEPIRPYDEFVKGRGYITIPTQNNQWCN
jgi:hypothetical protein